MWMLSGFLGQKRAVEAMGQQLPQGKGQLLALFVEADDLQIRGKFLEHLAAYPAGNAEVVSASGYGDADKIGVALADGLGHGGALGADGG